MQTSPSRLSKRVPRRVASTYAEEIFELERQALAATVTEKRLALGLSQETLAYEAEVDRSYISQIERGQGNPSLHVLCQLAHRLNLPLRDIFTQHGFAAEAVLPSPEESSAPGVFRKLFDRPGSDAATTRDISGKKPK